MHHSAAGAGPISWLGVTMVFTTGSQGPALVIFWSVQQKREERRAWKHGSAIMRVRLACQRVMGNLTNVALGNHTYINGMVLLVVVVGRGYY